MWKLGILSPRECPSSRTIGVCAISRGTRVAAASARTGVPGRSTGRKPRASMTARHSRSTSISTR